MITRHGWAATVAAAACFAIGRVFGLIELYVVGVGIVMALLVAIISVQRRLPPLNVRRIVSPSLVAVGEPARIDIQLANLGRQSSPYLQLWEPVGNNGGAPMQLAKLSPGQTASAAYRVPTARRGLIRTGPLRALRRDVLGLTQRTTTLAGTEEVLVVPRTIALPFRLISAPPVAVPPKNGVWGLWPQRGCRGVRSPRATPQDDVMGANRHGIPFTS